MNTANKTILFVEDNPLVLGIYRTWLQRDEFRVESADDGVAALEKLPQLKPDLVILDLMLPRLNGLEVLKFIRQHPDLKATPVLILSNAYLNEPASKVMDAGANRRMLKTECTPARLIAAARELLGVAPGGRGQAQNGPALARANEALLEEARDNLLQDAAAEIARVREHCLAYVKTAGSPVSEDHLNDLYQRVRFLCARATLGNFPRAAQLVSALEATLLEIISRKSLPSPSVLQTIAQAVDCLGRLFQNGDMRSADDLFKAKVLIVDDDPICNFTTVAAMRRAKLEAISTELPATALKLAQNERFRIVLLDINMPGLNGFELCKQIRLLPHHKRTPIIFVTSYSEFQNRAQAVLSGGDDLIAKPIFPLELVLKTIMCLLESSEEHSVNLPAVEEPPSAPAPAVSGLTGGAGSNGRPMPLPAPQEGPGVEPENGEAIVPAKADDLFRTVRPCPPPAGERLAPVLCSPDQLFVPPAHAPQIGATREIFMKMQSENQPFELITREVACILFGEDHASGMPLRLTRIALQHYNVQAIIHRGSPSGANGNGLTSATASGDAFGQVAHEVTRIIFGDENQSEMQLRLTRIALERYHVPEAIHGLRATDGENGTPVEPARCGRR
jgi:DNA-binding response OmpR family regulator